MEEMINEETVESICESAIPWQPLQMWLTPKATSSFDF